MAKRPQDRYSSSSEILEKMIGIIDDIELFQGA